MPVRPLRQMAKQRTLLVRARLSHQWKEGEPGPSVIAVHRQTEKRDSLGGSVLHGVRARVGQIFDRELGDVVRDANGTLISGTTEGGWRPTIEPEEIPAIAEYIQALAHGDLWPANQETANALNGYERAQGLPAVKYDPAYGGELAVLKEWLDGLDADKADAAAAMKVNAKAAAAPPAPTLSVPAAVASTPKPPTEGKV